MISRTTPQFWQRFDDLPLEVQQLAVRTYSIWQNDPAHGSLHFKKLANMDALWSIRVGRQYRALARRQAELVIWVWIGHHSEYDQLIRGR